MIAQWDVVRRIVVHGLMVKPARGITCKYEQYGCICTPVQRPNVFVRYGYDVGSSLCKLNDEFSMIGLAPKRRVAGQQFESRGFKSATRGLS